MLLEASKLKRAFRNRSSNAAFRAVAQATFRNPGNIIAFGQFCFPHHLKLASPEFHYELAELLNTPGNVGVAAPRGHAKSTIATLVYLAWLIVNQEYHFILPISDTYSQSVEFVNTLRDELANNQMLRFLYGDLVGPVWGSGVFETSTGIKVLARGMGMKIRGLKYRQYRPELLLVDDIENDAAVQNAERREKLRAWFTRAALPAMAKGGRAIVLGTILHADSLLNNIVTRQGEFSGWTTRIYRAINQAPDGTYTALWPALYSVAELVAMRDDPGSPHYIGSLVFQQEYQNEPIDEKDAIIKRAWIKRADALPIDIVQRAIFADPAVSKKEAADFFAKIAVALDARDTLYIYRIGNDRLSFSAGVAAIYQWNADEQPAYIGIEAIAFQQAYLDVTKGLPVIELTPDKDKHRRLLAVSRFFEGGKVAVLNNIPNAELLIDQLVHFPNVKHDDLVDVVAYAIDRMLVKRFGSFGTDTPDRGQGLTATLPEHY